GVPGLLGDERTAASAREVDPLEPHPLQRRGVARRGLLPFLLERVRRRQFARPQVGLARRRLAQATERTEALGRGAEPLLVLEIDAIDDLDELEQVLERVEVPPCPDVRVRANPQHRGIDHPSRLPSDRRPRVRAIIEELARRLPSRSCWTSSMICRALWARRPWLIASESITWMRCRLSRYGNASGPLGRMNTP